MRFMIIRKADPQTEAGVMPSAELLDAMQSFNEEMVRAGVMLAGDGLRPSRDGARVKFRGGKPTIVDGPFAESKELVAGYSIIQAGSKAEALDGCGSGRPSTATARSSSSCASCTRPRTSAPVKCGGTRS